MICRMILWIRNRVLKINFLKNNRFLLALVQIMCYYNLAWGYSSVGRALEWHSRGQGFDSPYLHQTKKAGFYLPFLFGKGAENA